MKAVTRIKIDIDGSLPKDVAYRIAWVFQTLRAPVAWWSCYRTRRGWHVEVAVKRRWHPWRVIAVQAILGSDWRRETYNLRRVAAWRTLPGIARQRWNVLFTQKFKIVA